MSGLVKDAGYYLTRSSIFRAMAQISAHDIRTAVELLEQHDGDWARKSAVERLKKAAAKLSEEVFDEQIKRIQEL